MTLGSTPESENDTESSTSTTNSFHLASSISFPGDAEPVLQQDDVVGPPEKISPSTSNAMSKLYISWIDVQSNGDFDIAMIKRPKGNINSPKKGDDVGAEVSGLVISEDGNTTEPSSNGGSLTISFTENVTCIGMATSGYVHVDDLVVSFYDSDGHLKGEFHSPEGGGENGIWTVSDVIVDGVRSIEFVSSTSGILLSVDYVPTSLQ